MKIDLRIIYSRGITNSPGKVIILWPSFWGITITPALVDKSISLIAGVGNTGRTSSKAIKHLNGILGKWWGIIKSAISSINPWFTYELLCRWEMVDFNYLRVTESLGRIKDLQGLWTICQASQLRRQDTEAFLDLVCVSKLHKVKLIDNGAL